MILEYDGVASKTNNEKVKSLALKAKVTMKQTSDDNDSQGGSDEDEVEAFNLMARNFQVAVMVLGIKESEAHDKSKVNTIAEMKVTSLAYDGGHVVFRINLKGNVIGGVKFTKVDCSISKNGKTLAKGHRRNELYTCKLGDNSKQQNYLASVVDNSTLWHRRLGHANIRLIQNLASNKLVRILLKLSFERHFCNTCGLRSQGNANNRTRIEVSTTKVLKLLHLDLFGPSPIQIYRGNFYTLMIIDDHLNYIGVVFVESKDDVLKRFKILCKKLENLHDCSIVSFVTNHSSEFDNMQFLSFCEQNGMSYNLSGPFTSQSSETV
ncbi:retrovirus-related pol polyprotein from transposon TNT 1-94 [Tanacetum coccineum]